MTKPKELAPNFSPGTINSDKLVMKDNALIMGSYSLTVEEQRLILACIEKAQRQQKTLDNDAIEITLTVNEYANIYKVKMSGAYRTLSSSSDKLYERSIRMNDQGVRRKVRWLQEQAVYDSGKINLVFSSVVSKHIREIVTKRSTYRLQQATQLRSQHAIRLFEILQIVIDPETQEGVWEVTVDELKDLFEIADHYDRWIDLKKKVILPSVLQINKNTSLKVDWEVAAKDGRSIVGLRFFVFEANQLALSMK